MQPTTHTTERSTGYLAIEQLSSNPFNPSANGCSLILATGMQVGKNLLKVVAGKAKKDRLDKKFYSYQYDNKLDNGKHINLQANSLRSSKNYTKL